MNTAYPSFQLPDLELPHPNKLGGWSRETVLGELGQILNSRFFVKSERLSCFLKTAVSYLLEGKADSFKEYTVGTEVYNRPASYDPTQDSIVRTEARRLRTKLKEYYANQPVEGQIMIVLSAGSYIPSIASRTAGRMRSAIPWHNFLTTPTLGTLPVAVLPFHVNSTSPFPQYVASKLEDEIIHHLVQERRLTVFRAPLITPRASSEQVQAWDHAGVQVVIHGSISESKDSVIAHVQLATLSGMILWSERLNCDSLIHTESTFTANLLAAVLEHFPPANSDEAVC